MVDPVSDFQTAFHQNAATGILVSIQMYKLSLHPHPAVEFAQYGPSLRMLLQVCSNVAVSAVTCTVNIQRRHFIKPFSDPASSVSVSSDDEREPLELLDDTSMKLWAGGQTLAP